MRNTQVAEAKRQPATAQTAKTHQGQVAHNLAGTPLAKNKAAPPNPAVPLHGRQAVQAQIEAQAAQQVAAAQSAKLKAENDLIAKRYGKDDGSYVIASVTRHASTPHPAPTTP